MKMWFVWFLMGFAVAILFLFLYAACSISSEESRREEKDKGVIP